ncbi:M15 family metallopeptidase [Streptosporangium lutulentum]|uniref:D-alanyl-D-alanine dipeptidase n=1 Tax=Streptosporangium lutulentum TaxID=1461250 RepID=A0ABT9Q568_9ACTN|nr:M15 family metallopeptidase [Streptosporangium lutulentum]MDP9841885.1 D-alanyl-D-alanine dipeptidase [Streptosporangium lutulentum]
MSEIVLLSDPRILELRVEECGEPLVDLREMGVFRIDMRLADPAGAFAHLRSSVASKLVAAQTLLPRELRFLVVEGYRPPVLQEQYFSESVEELRGLHPDWSAERLRCEAGRYISPPEVAPHVAGAAVDVTLCTDAGIELMMGTEVNATPTGPDGACYTASPDISQEARDNRRTLIGALTAVGLVNYPTEWWHWSYGDRYWAFVTGAPSAMYGASGGSGLNGTSVPAG